VTRVVALVGPTGVGKTDVGMALAAVYGAEIVNADSRQVYRRLDIGSAKPTPAQRALVPHHLVDLVDPDESFDCARFRELAVAAIDDIAARGKRVLVVGGTGLYVKALLRGLFAGPSRDAAVRADLEREEAATPGCLHRHLTAVDPAAAARLHPHDHVRLIRALEVYRLTGRRLSAWQAEHAFAARQFDSLILGLTLPRAELYAVVTPIVVILARIAIEVLGGCERGRGGKQRGGNSQGIDGFSIHGKLPCDEGCRKRPADEARR